MIEPALASPSETQASDSALLGMVAIDSSTPTSKATTG